jgi:hypothetical protein
LDLREKLADVDKDDDPKYGIEVAQRLLVEAKPVVGLDAASGGGRSRSG